MTNARQELDIARLETLLQSADIGHTIDYHRVIGSTMPRAHQLAQEPSIPAGYLVVTEQQSAGRGRSGRSWIAPYARGLLFSAILKPPLLPANPSQIPMAAGIALCNALVDTAPELEGQVSLKWPNDVLIGAGKETRKAAGILAESAYDSAGPLYAILGIGINVNQTQDELPSVEQRMSVPTSLRIVLGRQIDRTTLLAAVCLQLEHQFVGNRAPDVLFSDWRSRLSTLGQQVRVRTHTQAADEEIDGTAVDVSADGELLVRDVGGRIHRFSSGDVSVRTHP